MHLTPIDLACTSGGIFRQATKICQAVASVHSTYDSTADFSTDYDRASEIEVIRRIKDEEYLIRGKDSVGIRDVVSVRRLRVSRRCQANEPQPYQPY